MPDRLAQDRRDDALRCALHQLHPERAADAVAEEKELVGCRGGPSRRADRPRTRPGIVDRDRTGGPAAGRVALVHGDHAEVALNSSGMLITARAQPSDGRVQPAAGRRQQREARADLGVADADTALLEGADLERRPAILQWPRPAVLARTPAALRLLPPRQHRCQERRVGWNRSSATSLVAAAAFACDRRRSLRPSRQFQEF